MKLGTLAIGAATMLLAGFSAAAMAANVDLANTSALGDSWDLGSAWSDGLPAHAGDDYRVGFSPANRSLRTPHDVNNPVFPGDSLTIFSTGSMGLKHNGTATFADLRLDGGTILASTGNRTMGIGGNMNVVSTSTISLTTSGDVRHIRLTSALSGNGDLVITGNSNYSMFTFRADPSAYAGALLVDDSLDRLHVESTAGSSVTVKGTGSGLNYAPFEEFDVAVNGMNATVVSPSGQPVDLGDGTGSLSIARRWSPSANDTRGHLDLSAASSVNIDVTNVRLGTITNVAQEGDMEGLLTLSQTGVNSVTVTNITVGDSPARGNTDFTSEINLGGAANNVDVDTLVVGGRKSKGRVDMAAGGTLTLGGKTGAAANVDLGVNVDGTGTHTVGTLDATGGTFNATIGTLRIGKQNGGGGSGTGTLAFDAGNVSANTVNMATGDKSTGTIIMDGGAMNVAGNVSDGAGTSNINVNGGTMTVAGDLSVDNLSVAGNGGTATISAGGDVRIGNGTANNMGLADTTTAPNANGIADFSSAGSVTINVSTLHIGTQTDNAGNTSRGTLELSAAGANSVTASTILMGDSPGAGNASVTSEIVLGGSTNDFSVNQFTIAGRKSVAEVSILPGGSFSLAGTGGPGTGTLDLSRRTVDTGANTLGTLDLADAASVNIDVAAIRLGTITTGATGGDSRGIWNFSNTTNTVSANTILVGDSSHAANTDIASVIALGSGANNLNVDTLTIGGQKSNAQVTIGAGGTFTLGGKTAAAADLRIGYNSASGTGTNTTASMDLTGGTFNATLDQVVIGFHADGGGGSGNGTLTMQAGSVTANSILLAEPESSSNPANTVGTFNLAGGTLEAGTIDDGGGTANFNFTGGILQVDTFGFTLDQDGGTLAAGNSPGQTDILGGYNFNSGVLEVEINALLSQGTDPGYDFYNVAGDAVLGNTLAASDGDAMLKVLLTGSYSWSQGDFFDVLEAATITINDDFVFDRSANGGLWNYAVIDGDGTQVLRITADVPEPATVLVWSLLAGLGIGLRWRRTQRVA